MSTSSSWSSPGNSNKSWVTCRVSGAAEGQNLREPIFICFFDRPWWLMKKQGRGYTTAQRLTRSTIWVRLCLGKHQNGGCPFVFRLRQPNKGSLKKQHACGSRVMSKTALLQRAQCSVPNDAKRQTGSPHHDRPMTGAVYNFPRVSACVRGAFICSRWENVVNPAPFVGGDRKPLDVLLEFGPNPNLVFGLLDWHWHPSLPILMGLSSCGVEIFWHLTLCHISTPSTWWLGLVWSVC